jgi:hypothetical protein
MPLYRPWLRIMWSAMPKVVGLETIEQGHGGDLVRRDAEVRRIGTVEER